MRSVNRSSRAQLTSGGARCWPVDVAVDDAGVVGYVKLDGRRRGRRRSLPLTLHLALLPQGELGVDHLNRLISAPTLDGVPGRQRLGGLP